MYTFDRNRWLGGVGCLILVLVLGCSAFAQIGLSTFALDLEIPPGTVGSDTVTVSNQGEESRSVVLEIVDWLPTGPADQQYLEPGTLERSVSNWLNLWPSEMTLEPGESRDVQVEITVPLSCEGSYWGMIFFKLSSSKVAPEGSSAAVGMNVILAVAVYVETGGGTREGRITGFSCKEMENGRQVMFSILFDNVGTRRLWPTGRIQISNDSGETERVISLSKCISLPGAEQVFRLFLTQVPPEDAEEANDAPEPEAALEPGSYQAVVIIDYGGDSLVAAQLPFELQEKSTEKGS